MSEETKEPLEETPVTAETAETEQEKTPCAIIFRRISADSELPAQDCRVASRNDIGGTFA